VARKVGWDVTRLSRIERGLYRIASDEVRHLCDVLGVDDAEAVEEVARVAEAPPGRGWWAPYVDQISGAYLDFIELEAQAESVRICHPGIIPGPLQTATYAREIISRSATAGERHTTEMLVNIRIARQEVLTRQQRPVDFHALVPEAALHARFETGPALMRDQIRKLLDMSELPNVTLQLLPLTTHPAYGSDGALTVLGFHHPWLPIGSVDNQLGGSHTEDPTDVGFLVREFNHIASVAFSADRTREVLNEHLEGLHT
jgi:hypothetical protein